MAFINTFGHDYQRKGDTEMAEVAARFEHDMIPYNLLDLFTRVGLDDKGARSVRKAIRRVQTPSNGLWHHVGGFLEAGGKKIENLGRKLRGGQPK